MIKQYIESYNKMLSRDEFCFHIGRLNNHFKYNENFSSQQIKQYWLEHMKGCRQHEFLKVIDFYIHIPFCASKCNFCQYPSYQYKDRKEIDRYVDFLIDSMEYYSRVFNGINFRTLFIGGGTPSLLDAKQLERLLENLVKYYGFLDGGRRTFECNPASVTFEKMKLLKSVGFNRITLGVESLNKKVLDRHRRAYQSKKVIKNAIDAAKKAGIEFVNIDLILGLAGESFESYKKSFAGVVSLKPDGILISTLIPPNDKYLSDYLHMTRAEFFNKHLVGLISKARKFMTTYGFNNGYDPYHLKDPTAFCWRLFLKDHPERFNVIGYGEHKVEGTFGVGIFSKSYIQNMLDYRQVKSIKNFDEKSRIYSGRRLSKKEAMIRFIINNLNWQLRIPLGKFKDQFGVSVSEAFPYVIHILKSLKKIKISRNYIYLCTGDIKEKYMYASFFIYMS